MFLKTTLALLDSHEFFLAGRVIPSLVILDRFAQNPWGRNALSVGQSPEARIPSLLPMRHSETVLGR